MLLGIDLGTSVTKAAAFDDDGTVRAVEARRTVLARPRDGWFEQDPQEVLASVADVVGALVARLGEEPRAIGLTGQGDGVWLVDGAARPVRPAICWLDARAAPIVAGWLASGVVAEVYRRTGQALFPGCAAAILSWLDREEPAALDRAATAAYCKDVVLQRLTGVRATDPSDASLPFTDPRTGGYDEHVLARCGLADRRDLLAPVTRPLPAGTLTAEAGRLLGLPPGLPVVAGPFDLAACALGSGVDRPGDGQLTIGTTLACQVLVDSLGHLAAEPAGMTLATGWPGRWLRTMPAMVGTAVLDWVLGMLGRTHEDLDALLAATEPGAAGVTCLPYFAPAGERAPFVEPAARGRLDGLTVHTRPADLVRAACEAVAYAARHCFEEAGLAGSVAVGGGGAASGRWLRIFADVLDRPVRVARGPEVGARGAALAAAQVLQLPVDPGRWTAPERVVEPGPAARERYADGYARYRLRVADARRAWEEER